MTLFSILINNNFYNEYVKLKQNEMRNAIPNPTRKVTVNFSIDKVKQAIKDYPLFKQKKTYRMFETHETMNFFILETLEFLSLGVYIDVNLNEVSETKTEIAVEVRRKLGAFDEWYEVQYAGDHINNLITGLGQLLEKPNLGETLRAQNVEKEAQLEAEKGKTPVGLAVFVGLAVGFLFLVIILVASA